MIRPYDVVKEALSPAGWPVRNAIPPADRTAATFYVVTIGPSTTGGSRPGWVERVTADVEAWVGDGQDETRKSRCIDVAVEARDLLFRAWQTSRRTDAGAINYVPDIPWPYYTPSGLDGVWRARFQVPLTIRR